MDPRQLAERLIRYDTSTAEGLRPAAGFIKGWLEARDIDVREYDHEGMPVLLADVGPKDGPSVIFHGHYDVVPGRPEQFEPRIEGDRLIGRGAYDMKGGLAAMMCAAHDAAGQSDVRVRFLVVPDEENAEIDERSTEHLVAEGYSGDFAITGEPTDLHIGIQAKGVLAMRLHVTGRAAHGSTPWLGDNAVLKAHDVFRRIESLPFARESTELFDRPSINLARIMGGDALNKVPDSCVMDVDVRYLPDQDYQAILEDIRSMADVEVLRTFVRPPAIVSRSNPFVVALQDALTRTSTDHEVMSIGRDGASDAVAFLEAGIPAVEFGPLGGGHHGPDEWVSIASLETYRRGLNDFVAEIASRRRAGGDDVAPPRETTSLESIEGVKR